MRGSGRAAVAGATVVQEQLCEPLGKPRGAPIGDAGGEVLGDMQNLAALELCVTRGAEEAANAAAELLRREAEAETRRAAACAARRSRPRGQRPNHLRSVE